MKIEQCLLSIEEAAQGGGLMSASVENIKSYLNTEGLPQRMVESLAELIETQNWEELNDRFHSNLAFGTGGMRGRTIGKTITAPERGSATEKESPQFPAVGSNTLNELTVLQATKALYNYVNQWMSQNGLLEQPRLVVAHDVRHFSRHFCQLTALAWRKMGGFAMVFDGPRSTPQLSFAVRNRYAHAGVVITASHNPYHDNGFKAYFEDGAQLVPPHANRVVDQYRNISLEEVIPWLDDFSEEDIPKLSTADDLAYRAALEEAVLDPQLLKTSALKCVFTPIHGTGAVSAVPALWDHGVEVCSVDEQNLQDPNFSSVQSPNPENPEALKLGIAVASKTKSDLVMGSDPDCDRIGVAALGADGKFRCLTGNHVACMLSEYRLQQLRKLQLLKDGNETGFALLKTFVTSPLIDKIASAYKIRCVNTPTGFKWMSKKLRKHEETAVNEIKDAEGLGLDFDDTDLFTRIEILSRYSTYVPLAAEESYGYLPINLVRDKDGNASALAIAELFAFLKSSKMTAFDYLDSLYQKYGYHFEKTENIYFEGAEGSRIIKDLAKSYRESQPSEICGIGVTSIRDFLDDGQIDEDEDPLPKENFLLISLENDFSVAIRPSGTEPKIKYYVFGSGKPRPASLEESKKEVSELVDGLAQWLAEDAHKRVAGQ